MHTQATAKQPSSKITRKPLMQRKALQTKEAYERQEKQKKNEDKRIRYRDGKVTGVNL